MALYTFYVLLFVQFVLSAPFREDGLLEKVHIALDKVLDFIYENRNSINLDGFFSVAMGKGQIQAALNVIEKRQYDEVLHFKNQKTLEILQTFDPTKMNLNEEYKLFSEYLLNSRIWETNTTFQVGNLNNDLIKRQRLVSCGEYKKALANSQFSEVNSDYCIAELIKSRKNAKGIHHCAISNFCYHYMIENNNDVIGYYISHRLLYLQIARALECNWNTTFITWKAQTHCSSIYLEAKLNYKCSDSIQMDDLFLEQVLYCGLEGFQEFLQTKWIHHVLNLQNKYGCYGAPSFRNKRATNGIKYGCFDHTTGLGAAVLSLILRFLIH